VWFISGYGGSQVILSDNPRFYLSYDSVSGYGVISFESLATSMQNHWNGVPLHIGQNLIIQATGHSDEGILNRDYRIVNIEGSQNSFIDFAQIKIYITCI
jgi:hypothetical protein